MATKITGAGNTEVPCYLAAKKLGFEITREFRDNQTETWFAKSNDLEISGESPVEILGLIYMCEIRGESWKADDDQIDAFTRAFYPESV